MSKNIQFIAFRTIAAGEVRRIQRIWAQTIIPPMITMMLYFIIFGGLIGQRVGMMAGRPYMAFIVPGLIMMTIIQNAYTNTSSSFFGSKFGRSVEELLVAPVENYTIILGYIVGGIYRGFISGVVVLLVSMYFTKLTVHHVGVMLMSAFLTSVLFSIAGLINAIFAKKFDDVALIPTFVLTPLTYLGGVFYSIDLLKGVWYKIALFNPIVYVVETFRYGMLGTEGYHVYVSLFIIFIFTLLLFFFCLYLLRTGIGLRS